MVGASARTAGPGAAARAAGLGAAATVATGWLAWWFASGVLDRWSGVLTVAAVEESFTLLASATASAVAAWTAWLLACATVALLRDAVRGRSDVPHGGPTGRVVAALLVAATLGGAQAGAASAAPAPVPAVRTVQPSPAGTPAAADPATPVTTDPGSAEEVPVPGWTPTSASVGGRGPTGAGTVGEVGLVSTAPAAARPSTTEVVVVRAGDTLWEITARHLGEHATDQDVAEAWPRWYAANRAAIGADPDLILPGQRLVAPAEDGR